jgi:tRNA 2-selenouridine synthase
MDRSIEAAELLSLYRDRVLLDVRSPGEYAQGHIPGAVPFPLFSDEARAQVGTVYKQQGKEPALELGLELTGPKMAGFVRDAKKYAPDRQIAVHCWRGGQRSRSMAWLLGLAGFDVLTLEGGYKLYRRHVLEHFETASYNIVLLGGRTGSGKTKILRALHELGEQVIDLEALAHHKGSAFGSIGEAPQPTVEQFENDLFAALQNIDPTRRVWVENESRSIGRVFVPDGFWAQMKAAPLFNIEIPHTARIQNLLDDYVLTDKSELEAAFLKIDKKLGGQHLKTALEALEQGDFAAAAEVALRYYDKTYQHGLDTNVSPDIRHLRFEHGRAEEIAKYILNF